ncbi:FecR family protein [Pinibacter aurantiacus]|uniref:FecR domain-containing protein n=1 Tax=Pinibacter aurantiacus TaxID=2851599 RepID=A0A9E2SEY4_9BACT|nr:FecR family protein [Pinibacter aurantiacus]MBV4360352.1 FecR domain-containing protein [Pinibacter aurantiacus]
MNYSSWSIQDFLADESFVSFCFANDPEAVTRWENVQQQQPSLIPLIQKAKNACLQLSALPTAEEKQHDLEKLRERIQQLKSSAIVISLNQHRSYKRAWIAAAAMIVVIAGAFLFSKNYTATNPRYAQVYTTGFDERKDITLPDGSTVTLNAFSRLKVAEGFNITNRDLLLDGEAYFEVAQHAGNPFTVKTSKTSTTALGTAFKVRNYNADKKATVMLSSGKVKVGIAHSGTEEILNPGEEMIVGEIAAKKKFDITCLDNWKTRKLVFREADEKEIISKLNSMFGVEVMIDSQHAKPILFTGQFNGRNLTEVLDAIGFTNTFKYRVSNDTIHISFDK